MKKMFKESEDGVPVEVEVETGVYPERDADGDTIFENSHFWRIGECWDSILSNQEAHVVLATRDYEGAKQRVYTTKTTLAEAAAWYVNVKEKHGEWLHREDGKT